MNEDFVPFELAKKLKDKGFRWDCFSYYMPHSDELIYNVKPYKGVTLYSFNSLRKELISSDFIDAPTISQVLKWLRDEKKIHVLIAPILNHSSATYHWGCEIYDISRMPETVFYKESLFNMSSHNEAALAGIEYVIDNLI